MQTMRSVFTEPNIGLCTPSFTGGGYLLLTNAMEGERVEEGCLDGAGYIWFKMENRRNDLGRAEFISMSKQSS